MKRKLTVSNLGDFPEVCSCCLTPTKEKRRFTVVKIVKQGLTEWQSSFKHEVPVCRKCKMHHWTTGLIPLLINWFLLPFPILLLAKYFDLKPTDKFMSILFPIWFLGIPVLIFINKYVFWPLYNSEHGTAEFAIKIKWKEDDEFDITFYNEKYYEMYIKHNNLD